MARSEKSILNEALVLLSGLPETLVFRNNTGMAWQGQKVPTRAGQMLHVKPGMMVLMDARPITFGLPGSADILGVSQGRAIAIETKALWGKQREQQALFQRAFSAAGGLYGLAYTPQQAVDLLKG